MSASTTSAPTASISASAALQPARLQLLTPALLAFLAELHRTFESTRLALLAVNAQGLVFSESSGPSDFISKDDAVGEYKLVTPSSSLITTPRDWHLTENDVCVNGAPISASLFDFALAVFHNAQSLATPDLGPVFSLAILHGRNEAALWDDVMAFAEVRLGLPIGTIKVVSPVKTPSSGLERDGILHALKGRITAFN